jgi:hypothetical protein
VIHGKPMVHPDGKGPVIHLSHLELSPDATWMYFTPLFGPILWRVETRYLQDPRGVLTLGPDGKLRTLIRDDRISGPNEGSIGPDGYYYFPNSQAPRVNRPYEVFKVELQDAC